LQGIGFGLSGQRELRAPFPELRGLYACDLTLFRRAMGKPWYCPHRGVLLKEPLTEEFLSMFD